MADTNLGNLAYKLTLDKSQFTKDMQTVRSELQKLLQTKTVTLTDVNKSSLKQIQKAIDQAEFKIKKLILDDVDRDKLQGQINEIVKSLVARINLELVPTTKGGTTVTPQAVDALTKEAQKAQREEQKRAEASERANRKLQEGAKNASALASMLSKASAESNTLQGALKSLKPIIGDVFSLYALKRFMDGLIEVGGEIQKQRMALGHILGNDSNANILFNQMKDLAVKSPFGLLDLMQNARQLSAFGVEYNKLYDTMKRLSDVAAGLGIQFGRLSLAYGETMERGFLDGKLVRQFSYMGLPILQEIAKYYTEIDKSGKGIRYSAADIRKMVSERAVSYEDMDAVIQRMTDVGGKFADKQEVMVESVAGKWKNLKDAVDIMFSDMAEGNSELIKAPAEILTNLVKNYQQFEYVLLGVATRMVGARVASALYSATLGKQLVATEATMIAEKKATVATQMRDKALRGASISQLQQIASSKALTMEEMKQAITSKQLSAHEAQLVVARQGLNKANAELLLKFKLITQEEYRQLMSGKSLTFTYRNLSISLRSLGVSLKLATAQFRAMAAAMLSNPMTWITAAIGGLLEISNLISNINDKNEQIRKGVQDRSLNTVQDAIDIYDEVNLDRNIASATDYEVAIDELVKFIKDNVPGAQKILDKAFALSDDGQYAMSLEQRYSTLYDFFFKVRHMLDDGKLADVQEAVQSLMGSTWWNAIGSDSLLQDASDFEKNYKNAKDNILSTIRNGSKETRRVVEEYRQAFNVKTDEDLVSKLLMPENEEALEKFVPRIGNVFQYMRNAYSVRNLKADYIEYMNEMESFMDGLKSRMKQIYGDNFDINNPTQSQRMNIEYSIRSFLDESEASDWVKQHMVNDFNTRWNLDISVGGEVKTVESIWKKLYGDKISVSDKDNISDVINNAKKLKKEAREALDILEKDKKYSSLQSLGKSDEGLFRIFGLDQSKNADKELYEYGRRVNEMVKQYNDAKYVLDREGIPDDEKAKNGSQKDLVLEAWKERFDKLKKTYSEFKKWKEQVGADQAGAKMRQFGMMDNDVLQYFGLTEQDLNNPQKYEDAVKNFHKRIHDKLTTEARKKWEENVYVEWSAIDLNITQEALKKAAEKLATEMNNTLKQYDIFKTWFGLTGNKDLAMTLALNITPMWDEKSQFLKDAFEKQASAKGYSLDINYNMENTEAEEFFAGDKGMLDFYKQVRDAFRQGGIDAARAIADAVKGAISTAETIDAINAKYDRLIATDKAQNGGLNGRILESQRQKELEKLDPTYKQFMSAVTSLTIKEAQRMGDSIKSNLTDQLANGTITMDEYASGIKKVDDQLKKSTQRLRNVGDAWLLGKQLEYAQNNYDNALFGKNQAAKNVADAQRAVDIANLSGDRNAIQQALKNLTSTTEELERAELELKEASGELTKQEKRQLQEARVNAFVGKVKTMTDAFDMIGNTLDSFNVDLGSFTYGLETLKAGANGASQGASIAKTFGLNTTYGAAIGAALSMASSVAQMHDKALAKDIEESKKRTKVIEDMASNLEKTLERTLGGINSVGIDNDTKNVLNNILNRNAIVANFGGKDILDGRNKFYSADTRQIADEALRDNSYYKAQQAALLAQRDELNRQLNDEQDKKKPDDGVVQDYKQQLKELNDEITHFAEDMAKALYSIDFKDWASQLSDAVVGAWQNGENAVQAYQNTVSDMIRNVMKSVVQQNIMEKMLNPIAERFVEQFEADGGKMTDKSQSILAELFDASGKAGTMITEALNAANMIANEKGASLKGWASQLGNSISGVTEETADVLAGMISSMRVDLTTNKQNVENIYTLLNDESWGIQRQTAIAEGQLAQLEMIVQNTLATSNALANIERSFNDVLNGNKTVHIS